MPRMRTHPGDYLREEYLEPMDLSAGQLADALDLPRSRIGEIVREPVLFAALGGLVLCFGALRARAAPLLGAAVAAGCAFAILAAAGLPVLGRYLLLTGAYQW